MAPSFKEKNKGYDTCANVSSLNVTWMELQTLAIPKTIACTCFFNNVA